MADQRYGLADQFAGIARALVSERGTQAKIDRILLLAVEVVDACEHAGMTLVERGRIHPVASSDDVPIAIDKAQDEAQEGPCFDAIREHEVFTTGALAEELRWPRFARRAFEASGVQSILSVRLFSDGSTIGALNLYSTRRHAFGDDDVHMASILAAHAAVALMSLRQEESLLSAIETRDVIGRAKGILMARSDVSDEEAFDMLRSASQRMNVKLRDVARDIAEGRPPHGPSPAD